MAETLQDFSNEAYGEISALRYNIFESRSSGFAMQAAPKIMRFYQQTSITQTNRHVLDVACGTGQLAAYFLDHDYQVVGLDSSAHMLRHARDNNAQHIASGQVEFVDGDASSFHFDQQFGLVVCIYNALNHLANFEEVRGFLACAYRSLAPGGYLLFDINTRRGLKRTVESNELFDTDEEIIVRKRIFDGQRVILYASGCFLYHGKWHRYRETIFKIIIDTEELRQSLLDQGWSSSTFTSEDYLNPVDDPEAGNVAYMIACKAE